MYPRLAFRGLVQVHLIQLGPILLALRFDMEQDKLRLFDVILDASKIASAAVRSMVA